MLCRDNKRAAKSLVYNKHKKTSHQLRVNINYVFGGEQNLLSGSGALAFD